MKYLINDSDKENYFPIFTCNGKTTKLYNFSDKIGSTRLRLVAEREARLTYWAEFWSKLHHPFLRQRP